jgi:hypothetical protein
MPRQLANAQRRRRPRRSQPRQVLEELPSIDCRWLARKKLFPKDYSTRRYSFDFINPAIHTLTLGPRSAELLLTTGETQLIAIKWLRINGMCQSARPAFQCPGCGHNRFKLFYRHGRFSGCYRCIGVPYASQQRSTKNRSRLQAARLRLFLGSLPGDTKDPARPELMGKRTYARFIARLRKYESKTSRKQKPITRKLSYRVLRPITAYSSQRHAIV